MISKHNNIGVIHLGTMFLLKISCQWFQRGIHSRNFNCTMHISPSDCFGGLIHLQNQLVIEINHDLKNHEIVGNNILEKETTIMCFDGVSSHKQKKKPIDIFLYLDFKTICVVRFQEFLQFILQYFTKQGRIQNPLVVLRIYISTHENCIHVFGITQIISNWL